MTSPEAVARLVVSGPTRLEGAGPIALRPRERAVLAAIAFGYPAPVSAARVVELVWGDDPPATARQSVHNHVARLRRALPDLVVTDGSGYRLAPGVVVDVVELAEAVTGDSPVDVALLDGLVQDGAGPAFSDLAPHPEVSQRRQRVERHVAQALEQVVLHLLDEGSPAALERARDLVERDPASERGWWLLALGLARSGRRREALTTIGEVRSQLVGRGVDLGPDLANLERLIIVADPVVHTASILAAPGASAVGGTGDRPVGIGALTEQARRWLEGEEPRTLLVVGPAGSGKTTAVQELARMARSAGLTTVSAACDPEPTAPLQPVVAVLEGLAHRMPAVLDVPGAGALGALSETLAERVGRAQASLDPHALLDLVERVVRRVEDPLLIVVEDLHWAPPFTLEAIRRMSAAADGCLRMAVTCRPELTGYADAEAVGSHALAPWTVRDVEEWLRAHEADDERRAAAAAWLHRETGGLPIFVRELTLGLLDQGGLGPSAPEFKPPATVPPAVAMVLGARIERLSPGAQRALEMASVLGSQIPVAWLHGMFGVTLTAVDELLRLRMLRPRADGDDELEIEHELLRRAALDRLSPAAASEIHHLALAALEASGLVVPPAVVARHAVGAAPIDRDRAVRATEVAGDASAAVGSHREAASWWLQALELEAGAPTPDPVRRNRIAIRAGQALLFAGDERGPAMLVEAAAEAEARGDWNTAAQAAIAICRLGPTSIAGGADDLAATLAARLLELVEDPGLRAALGAAATMVHSMAGAQERCRELFDAAEADARSAGTDEALVDVLPFAYMSISAPEDLERRVRLTDDLAGAADRLGHVGGRWSALHLRFSNQLQAGDPELRATAEELFQLTPEVGERQREWEEHYVRATLAHLDDDLDAAEAIIGSSLSYTDTVAESRVMAVYGVHLLGIRLAQGRLAELIEAIEGLVASQPEVGAWHAALALAAAHADRPEQARAAFDVLARRPEALARDYAFSGAALALGEAAVILGDPHLGRFALELLDPLAGRWSWVGTCTLGPIDSTRAGLLRLLQRDDEATEAARQAVQSCQALAAPGLERVARRRAG